MRIIGCVLYYEDQPEQFLQVREHIYMGAG